jgi:large subunit ribosomal protein L5
LSSLTGKKVVTTKTSKRTTFGMARGRPIGCKITLRGKDAKEFLERVLEAVDKKISKKVFDSSGNFSFGIREHIDISGIDYDPEIGIFGMDVTVTLERPGYRVKRKKISHKVGKKHMIKPEDAKDWVVKNYGVEII